MSLSAASPENLASGAATTALTSDDGARPGPAAAPLMDPGALQNLGEQLNSATVARGFARDYAQMWEQRYASLADSLERRDSTAALDAVLSVKTSSSMVGGLRLAALATELEGLVREGLLAEAEARLGEVAARGRETVQELQFSYILMEC